MIKEKLIKITAVVSVSLAVILLLLWAAVNYVIIPRFIIPKAQEYINSHKDAPLRLSIGKIIFNPFTGFNLQDVSFSGRVILRDSAILNAKEVDIDLALLPLLRKSIRIIDFEIQGANLNIGRDKNGDWNFQYLLDLLEDKDIGGINFTINKLTIKEAGLNYLDYSHTDPAFETQLINVSSIFKAAGKQKYELTASGMGKERKGAINVNLVYDMKNNIINGAVKFSTKRLNEYYDFYLRDIFDPWRAKAGNVTAEIKIFYANNKLLLGGDYRIKEANLTYGKYAVKGDTAIKQELVFTPLEKNTDRVGGITYEADGREQSSLTGFTDGSVDKSASNLKLSLTNLSFLIDKHEMLKNCVGDITVKENLIKVENLEGNIEDHTIKASGAFNFEHPEEFRLIGKIDDLDNDCNLKITNKNEGVLDWSCGIGNSYIKLHADISDLEKLLFVAHVDGNIQLPDILSLDKDDVSKGEEGVKGTVNISGFIEKSNEDFSSFNEELKVVVQDFSVLGLKPVSFEVNSDIEKGILVGVIPKTDFYNGSLYGNVKIDLDRWGAELHLEDFDLAEFSKIDPKLEGIRGYFNGNISLVSKWPHFDTACGGGFFRFTDCYLWNAPIFEQVKRGIQDADKNIETADFKLFEGNFTIGSEEIALENVFINVSSMKLDAKGEFNFNGKVHFTAGVTLSSGSVFRGIRQILIPVTIALDMVANCIQIEVYNRWSDLKYKVNIQPLAIITALFPFSGNRGDPDKYTLDELWISAVAQENKTIQKAGSANITPRKKKN